MKRSPVTAGLVVAAAGAVLLAPVAPIVASPAGGVVDRAARLLAGESLANIPFNLFQDIVNIPAVEVQALDVLAKSFFFTGNWLTPSATNLWGTDPGDPSHYLALADLLVPFPQLSGMYQPEIDPVADAAGTAGIGQQLALNAAAILPVSPSSDADWSAPLVPSTPITGFAPIDKLIWALAVSTGIQEFPLTEHWHAVSKAALTSGFAFDDTKTDPGLIDPSSGVGQPFGDGTIGRVPDSFGFPGTIPGGTVDIPDGTGGSTPVTVEGTTADDSVMPWAGTTFTLNLAGSLPAFLQSLEAAPNLSVNFGSAPDSAVDAAGDSATGVPVGQEGFTLVNPIQLFQAVQAVIAGLVVDFDPFVRGGTICSQLCADIIPQPKDFLGLLSFGNPYIDEWVKLADTPSTDAFDPTLDNPTGMANGITGHQSQFSEIFLGLQQDLFDFGNPPSDDPPSALVESPMPVPESSVMSSLIEAFAPVRSVVQQIADLLGYSSVDFSSPDGYTDYLDNTGGLLGLLNGL